MSKRATTHKYSTRSPTGLAEDEPVRWRSKRWTNSRHDRPWLSHHVVGPGHDNDRWIDRTPSWSRSPEYAYDHGVEITRIDLMAFADRDGNPPDRVRVFGEHTDRGVYAVIMLMRNGTMTTVVPISTPSIPDPVRIYLWALLEEKGHLQYDSDPHEGVQ